MKYLVLLIEYLRHIPILTFCLILGVEIGGWIFAKSPFAGFTYGLVGAILGFPSLILASIYVEIMIKRKEQT